MKARLYSRDPRAAGTDSFSLVEVVFAIAIVSFALVSILGLMAYSSQLVHQADNYGRLSNVTRQVLARLDSQAYAVTASNVATNAVFYFTYDGLPTNSPAGAYYQCAFSNVTPNTAPPALLQLQVLVSWPAPVYATTNIVNTSIVNYD